MPVLHVWYFTNDGPVAEDAVVLTTPASTVPGTITLRYTDEADTTHTLQNVAHASDNWVPNTFRYLGEASDWQIANGGGPISDGAMSNI